MKTLKTIFFSLAIVALMGCNNTNRDRTDDIDNSDLNLDDNSDDVIMNDPYNSNSNTGSVNDDRTAMYRQLNMTPEQIQRFESENPNFSDSISNSKYGRNATMDSSLRNILSADQYRQYESWMDNRAQNGTNTNTNNTNTSGQDNNDNKTNSTNRN